MDKPAKQPARRNGNGSRGLYKRVRDLKNNETVPDPEVTGLRYVARQTGTGCVRAYGQVRYRNPKTGKLVAKGLGRVPTPAEVNAIIETEIEHFEALNPLGGSLTLTPDQFAFQIIREQAARELAVVRSGVDPKSIAGAHGLTVEQAIEEHLAAPRPTPLSANTVGQYRRTSRLYLAPLHKVSLRQIESADLVKLQKDIHEEYGPQAAASTLRLLSAAWETARFHDSKLGDFPRLPRGATATSKPRKPNIKLSELPLWFKEVEAVGGQRRDIWHLGIMTALRKTDLISIRREHVNLQAGTLHIPTPKSGTAFELPLSEQALALVDRVLRSHNSEWLWPSDKSKSGHIEKPGPLYPPDGNDGFTKRWTMHDLRKWWASAAAACAINKYHEKLLMDHALEAGDVTASYIELEANDLRPSQQKVTDWLRERGLPL